ncbi:MAG: hypothetical protein H6626_03700 [Pseudobdellovibrionaceae bacterium]|nr:hypothetical protein [Bdellovibrionales bacterium]USN48204.1 MAG: hypothetical protein H6626_03700 [Pseudobdellovibrionaceae bacterium]
MKQRATQVVLVLWAILLSVSVWARPEYAAKHGLISCAACHVSPTGGGIRNQYGKLYGSRTFKSSPFSMHENFQGDLRAIYMGGENMEDTSTRSGFNWMSVIGSVNVPVQKYESGTEFNVVASYNFGNFTQEENLRDTYLLWSRKAGSAIEHVLVGQFPLPFGLLTDEHRTYVRMQNNTTWNHYYFGVLLSGSVAETIHYDWAFLDSEKDAPTSSFNLGLHSGTSLNVRWGQPSLPGYVGASSSYFTVPGYKELKAYSAYGVLSLDRLTDSLFRGALLFEHVVTENWNQDKLGFLTNASTRLVTDTAFKTAVQDKQSAGWYAQLNWDLTQKWAMIFKYDFLALDKENTGDGFHRRGLGFKHYANSNLNILARAEWAEVGAPSLDKSNAPAAHPSYWLVMHAWF